MLEADTQRKSLSQYTDTRRLQGLQQETMALTELIYVSNLVGESEHELGAILESSVRHNQLNGITGMLLYYRGGLMQVLEG